MDPEILAKSKASREEALTMAKLGAADFALSVLDFLDFKKFPSNEEFVAELRKLCEKQLEGVEHHSCTAADMGPGYEPTDIDDIPDCTATEHQPYCRHFNAAGRLLPPEGPGIAVMNTKAVLDKIK